MTLCKASSKEQSWVQQLMRFMSCVLCCRQQGPAILAKNQTVLQTKFVNFWSSGKRPNTWAMWLLGDDSLKDLIQGSSKKKNSSERRNSCTSCQAFRGANCKVCFDGAGFLPATLGQNQVVGGAQTVLQNCSTLGIGQMPEHMGNVTVGRWFSRRPYPRPPLKEKQFGMHYAHALHVMHSSLQKAGLLPASKHRVCFDGTGLLPAT